LLSPPAKKPSREDFGLPAHGGTLSADDQNRIEQGIAEKVRSYGIDNVDLPKPARIAIQERLEAFYRDTLAVTSDDLEDRLRAVATTALGIPSDVASTLNAEKRYRAALKHWDSYQTWQARRNPARAALERSHGYDTKHAMHLIRLMRMGLEALQTGELRVRRDDAEHFPQFATVPCHSTSCSPWRVTSNAAWRRRLQRPSYRRTSITSASTPC
jgi:hypothetical protein